MTKSSPLLLKWTALLVAAVLGAVVTDARSAEVAADQRQIAVGYDRLETLALRIADAVESTDAARSEQIRRAIGEARATGIGDRFGKVIAWLERERYTSARRDQTELATQLEELLRTVMADPRAAQIEEERKRLDILRREIRGALREQKSLRSRAERGESEQLIERQKDLADRIERLHEPAEATDRLNGRDAEGVKPSDGERGESTPQNGEGKPSEGSGKPSIAGRLEASREAMQKAEKKLAADDTKATEDQLEAQRELEAAQRETEERLRQIREEEQQRRLATLAERFRRMHEAQTGVLTATEKRAETLRDNPRSAETRAGQLATAKLASRQGDIGATAEQALRLVRADGSSLIFDDVLVQTIDDIRSVENRLRESRVDATMIALQRSVLEALTEMIAAVDESLDDLDKRKTPNDQAKASQGGGEPGLVSKIGELRMIRSMQARLLRQTKVWQTAEATGESSPNEVSERLASLADQQRRLAVAANAVGDKQP